MIALKILFNILEQKDPVLLNKIDLDWVLDGKVKDLYKVTRQFYDKQQVLPDTSHLKDVFNDPDLFKNVNSLSKHSIDFFIEELEERYNKYKYLSELYDIVNNVEIETFEELIEEHQNLILEAQKVTENTLNEIDCSESPDPENLIFKLPLGLKGFDSKNGGIASSELMLLGGYRGTGKSVLALHCAINRFRSGRTAAFISIEMRNIEVRNRIDAMITGVPIKALEQNNMTQEQLNLFYTQKAMVFCDSSDTATKNFRKLLDLGEPLQRGLLERDFRLLKRKENKLFLYDLPTCTPTNINYIASKLKHTHNLSMLVVDYLNIIKMPVSKSADFGPLDWKSQVARSEFLKTTARVNDIAVIAPIQIDEEGKVKFARAIEDAVDISLLFEKSKSSKSNLLSLRTSKIRNGIDVRFTLTMNQENLRITEFNEATNESN